jgi:Nitric oxide reductase subunit B, cytochrome c-like domain
VVDPAGEAIFTREDVMDGQEVFLRNGLMEYGSIFGHGAYLGPDYTADYLHNAALHVRDRYGGADSDRALPHGRRLPDQPLRLGDQHARVHGCASGRLPRAAHVLPGVLLQPYDGVRASTAGDRRRRRDP